RVLAGVAPTAEKVAAPPLLERGAPVDGGEAAGERRSGLGERGREAVGRRVRVPRPARQGRAAHQLRQLAALVAGRHERGRLERRARQQSRGRRVPLVEEGRRGGRVHLIVRFT